MAMYRKWYRTKTFWTSAAGVIAACLGLWAALDVKHAAQIGMVATAVAAFLANLGSVFARQGGVEAAKDAAAGVPPEAVG
jgi:hypothetical protein